MKIGYFEEEEGVKSSMRLMSFLSLLNSFFLSTLITLNYYKTSAAPDIYIVGIIGLFIVAAFAPKAIQKFAETNDFMNRRIIADKKEEIKELKTEVKIAQAEN